MHPFIAYILHNFIILYYIYLAFQQHKDEQQGFTLNNMPLCSMDLLMAGTETTATTMLWALVYLIKYPDVQSKYNARSYFMVTFASLFGCHNIVTLFRNLQ